MTIPAEPLLPLGRADLERVRAEGRVTVLQAGGWRRPDVVLVPTGGSPVVVKDFTPMAGPIRLTFGRWLAARELRAYRSLAGLRHVPRLLGRLDADAFVLEHRPGQRLSRQLAGSIPRDFMSRLEGAVRAMHARGVVHLDLRHRSNVLVDAGGEPVLIDFASALCLRARGRLGRGLLAWLARVDEGALAKWRVRLQPRDVGPGGATAASPGRGASRPM
jgi:hypothetical protein